MKLSDEQIQTLLEWFINSSETKKRWSDQRKKALEDNQQWIQPDVIKEMSDKDLETRFTTYYRTGGGRQSLNQLYRDRITRDRKRFRKTLLFLLDERVGIEERLDKVLDKAGEYHIEGFGRAIVTSLLMDFNPQKYCLWNHKTSMGFEAIGWKVYENKDPWGKAYLNVLNALRRLRDERPEFEMTLGDVDLFLHTISAEEEGKAAVKAVAEGTLFKRPVAPGGGEEAAFTMEKYLEEFIEANFDKINFGGRLELYEGEENSGRQFPTDIGPIDLLATDKETKQFVVIELKKGRSSDAVIGQILRYMGWVKENVAEPMGYGVRGIVIVGDEDERLQYALKLIPSVSLFTYKVSFELKRHA